MEQELHTEARAVGGVEAGPSDLAKMSKDQWPSNHNDLAPPRYFAFDDLHHGCFSFVEIFARVRENDDVTISYMVRKVLNHRTHHGVLQHGPMMTCELLDAVGIPVGGVLDLGRQFGICGQDHKRVAHEFHLANAFQEVARGNFGASTSASWQC